MGSFPYEIFLIYDYIIFPNLCYIIYAWGINLNISYLRRNHHRNAKLLPITGYNSFNY